MYVVVFVVCMYMWPSIRARAVVPSVCAEPVMLLFKLLDAVPSVRLSEVFNSNPHA